MARFSDSSIETPKPDDVYYSFFPASYVTKYLEEYVTSHVYAGRSIRERIIFGEAVPNVRWEPQTRSWIISTDKPAALSTPKLMVCAGLTSIPNMPSIPGQETFKGRIMHHRDFGSSSILEDPKAKHITVLGGAKSAADVAYAAAAAGKQVSWIIRKSGSGPGGLLPAKGLGPYKNTNEVLYTRLTAALNPSIWTPQTWATRLFHQSWIGRNVVDWIWGSSDASTRREAGFKERSDNTGTTYQNLQPDTPIFWGDDSSGVNQRPDFWRCMASDNVRVFRKDILELKHHQIVMPEETISSDVIVCGTGWLPSYHSFLNEDLAQDLGLPVTLPTQVGKLSNLEYDRWSTLEQMADTEMCRRFPRLQSPPPHFTRTSAQSPFRLYKYMVPISPEMQGIVFLGHIVIGNNFRAAECQALWAVAYLDGHLSLPSEEDMRREVAMSVAWCRRRYLSKGTLGHWLYFDLVPYTDALLKQLGLKSHKRNGTFKDFFSPCVAEDLVDLLGEFTRKGKLV